MLRCLAMKIFYLAKSLSSFPSIDTPLEETERRDVKGLQKNLRAGELKKFTGIDGPSEAPTDLKITVNAVELNAEEAAGGALSFLESWEQG